MTDEIRSVSSTGAEKGVKAAALNLVPTGPLMKLAEHYNAGAKKYAEHNWRGGYEWSKSYAALMRHALQFWDGQDNDEETGTPHMAAVAFHAFALLEYAETHPEFDDRYKPEVTESEHSVVISDVVATDPAEALRQLQRYQAFGPGTENSSDRDHLLEQSPKRGELFRITGIPFWTEDGETHPCKMLQQGDTVRIVEGIDAEGDVQVKLVEEPHLFGNVSATTLTRVQD